MLAAGRPAIDGADTRIPGTASTVMLTGTVLAVPQVRGAARWIPCSRGTSIEMQVTGLAGRRGSQGGIPMHAPTVDTTPPPPVLMRLLVRPREYRHPRTWVRVRFGCGIWNLCLGVLLLASAHWLGPFAWLGLIPLAGSALLFWTGYRLQHSVAS
jgi:hypothetical protein